MGITVTKLSTGIHLDFRVYDVNGNPLDPITVLPKRPDSITIDKRFVIEDPCTGALRNKCK
jgi:hypothetical protein